MHYFNTQLPAERSAARSRRAALYAKRKPSQPGDDDQEHDQEHDQEPLAQDQQVPSTPFPHAPVPAAAHHHHGAAQVAEEMAKPPVRLYVTASPEPSSGTGHKAPSVLRLKHLNVLSALMHRCLLEGDYERAGRAWGIILRTQVAGAHPVDPRNNGRWGIGAEILLRRTSGANPEPREPSQNTDDHVHRDMFSDEAFELAREYYQRLIVQHPNRKTHPNAIDDRSFYPAMFSLWILEVCDKSKRARGKAQRELAHPSHSPSNVSMDSNLNSNASIHRMRETEIHDEELAQAAEIAQRLDQLIASPPFDKQASLLQLRGHVCLWMSHLYIGTTPSNEDSDTDTVMGNTDDRSTSSGEQLTRVRNSNRELYQAKTYLQRAAENGAPGQAATLSSIHVRITELAQRFDRSSPPWQQDFDSFLPGNGSPMSSA